eukprot:m.149354 g.149354  ORF g.149354 m.149354 type:complete len:593 (-) comp16856_c0_seq1:683-2461(-)
MKKKEIVLVEMTLSDKTSRRKERRRFLVSGLRKTQAQTHPPRGLDVERRGEAGIRDRAAHLHLVRARRDSPLVCLHVPDRDVALRQGKCHQRRLARLQHHVADPAQLPRRLLARRREAQVQLRNLPARPRARVRQREADQEVAAVDLQRVVLERRVAQAKAKGERRLHAVRVVPAVADVQALVVLSLVVDARVLLHGEANLVLDVREGDRQARARVDVAKQNIHQRKAHLLPRHEVGQDHRHLVAPRRQDGPRRRHHHNRVVLRRSHRRDQRVAVLRQRQRRAVRALAGERAHKDNGQVHCAGQLRRVVRARARVAVDALVADARRDRPDACIARPGDGVALRCAAEVGVLQEAGVRHVVVREVRAQLVLSAALAARVRVVGREALQVEAKVVEAVVVPAAVAHHLHARVRQAHALRHGPHRRGHIARRDGAAAAGVDIRAVAGADDGHALERVDVQRQDVAVVLQQDSRLGRQAAGQLTRVLARHVVAQRVLVGDVEEAHLEHWHQDAQHGVVHLGLAHLAGRHRVGEGLAHEVAARHLLVQTSVDGGAVRRAPVGHDPALEAQILLQADGEGLVVLASPGVVDLVVAAHD